MSGRALRLDGACVATLIASLCAGTAGAAEPARTVAPAPFTTPAPATAPAPFTAPTDASGAAADATAATPPLNAVGSSAPSEDIRDIRGPKFIAPAWLWPALLAGGVSLAWGAYRAWRWLRRRRRPRVLLPFEVALQRLEDIRPLMQPSSAREFSTAVSDIVRSYIEQRFDVIATHQTTEEFLHDLLKSSNASLARHRALLSEFLHQCDLVKFAGISLTPQSMESLHHSARAFVLETAKPDEVTETRAATEMRATSPPTATQEAHDSLPST